MKSKITSVILAVATVFSMLFVTSLNAKAASLEDMVNSQELTPTVTGYAPLDKAVEQIFSEIFTENMKPYNKLKAIYDYMIKNYAGGTGVSFTGATANTAPYIKLDYSDNVMPKYDADRDIIDKAMSMIKTHQGACPIYTAISLVFFSAIGFESFRMIGSTRMASGGYGYHVWPVIVLDGNNYIFDAQIDDHIAKGGAVKYMRFGKLNSELNNAYSFSESENSQQAKFMNFASDKKPVTQITKIKLNDSSVVFNAKTKINAEVSVKTQDEGDIRYTYKLKEKQSSSDSNLKSIASNDDWSKSNKSVKVLAEKVKANTISFEAENSGNYELSVTLTKAAAVLSVKSVSFRVLGATSAENKLILNKTVQSINNPVSLRFEKATGANGKLDISYFLNNSTNEIFIESDKNLSSSVFETKFVPKTAGNYLIVAKLTSTDGKSSVASSALKVLKSIIGDVNGDGILSANDARSALRHSSMLTILTEEDALAADFDGDGIVTATDARMILRSSSGLT